jgi:hypothetical protein
MPTISDKLEHVPLGLLRRNARNPRVHSDGQITQIIKSIVEFGFVNPIVADESLSVIAGHGRLEAAKRLGLSTAPVLRVSGLTDRQKRALLIADNKIAENAAWDKDLLARELESLVALQVPVELLGFDAAEFDIMVGASDDDPLEQDAADEAIDPNRRSPAVSQLGDLWLCGGHRLLNADALDEAAYRRLIGDGDKAQAVVADFPYNVPIDGHASGLGKIRHREFAMASGEMSESEFLSFLTTMMKHLAKFSLDGSLHYLFMDWRHLYELLSAGRATYAELKNLCVWAKSNGGMGSLYRSQHEIIGVFKNGRGPHVNNVELGRRGRYRTNVWRYPGVNTFRKGRKQDLEAHPTVKPIRLVADAILDCTKPGNLVLDPVVGSGTTILACERVKRRALAIEIDPYYVDVAVRRFEALTSTPARHAETGLTFAETAASRLSEGRIG